jgi:hypothetical protein
MVASLFIRFKTGFQDVREEKYFQHQKNYNQFDDDDGPEFSSQGHTSKTLVIKLKNVVKNCLHNLTSKPGIMDPRVSKINDCTDEYCRQTGEHHVDGNFHHYP